MALEQKLLAVNAVPFTANGTQFGLVTVADTIYFKDKQTVYIKSNAVPTAQYQIKQVLSPTQFVVGPIDNNLSISNYSDISAYLVSDGTIVGAGIQDKTAKPTDKDHYLAVYESSPVNADRVIFVDQYGRYYNNDNPLPIIFDGTVSIGEVEIVGPSGFLLDPNQNGSINVVVLNSGTTKNYKNIYNEIPSVVNNSLTDIVSYTVPAGLTAILERVTVSGENIATFQVSINDSVIETRRTAFNQLNETFDFSSPDAFGVPLVAGDVILVTVIHYRPDPASFESRIQVIQVG